MQSLLFFNNFKTVITKKKDLTFFLKENYQYCDDGEELFHRRDIPTKHNEMCEEASVFEVVQRHDDFQDFTDGNVISKRNVNFEILFS